MKAGLSLLARTFLVLALVSPVAACLSDGGSVDTGSGGRSGSGGSGNVGSGGGTITCTGSGAPSDASDLATWANVQDVVVNGCHGSDCHVQGEREPIMLGVNAVALSDTALYQKLTTFRTDGLCSNRVLVKPCAPEESAFYLAQAGMCNSSDGGMLPYMPYGCSPIYDNCTPADKLEGIRQWILKGAPRP